MASGQTLAFGTVNAAQPPVSSAAQFDEDAVGRSVLAFDASLDEAMVWPVFIPLQYAGNGLTLTVTVAAATATTNNMVWTAEIDRVQVNAVDVTSNTYAAAQSATVAAPGTLGFVKEATFTFTAGAAMDNAVAGEWVYLRITRNGLNGSDTMANDAWLRFWQLKET